MKINTNLETLVAVHTHTHTHTHTDVQLENKNAQKTVASKANVNNFERKNYNIRNKIKKEVNSLCIQIHKLSLLSFLRLWEKLTIKHYALLYKNINLKEINCIEGGNV